MLAEVFRERAEVGLRLMARRSEVRKEAGGGMTGRSGEGDEIDFDAGVFGKTRDFDGGAGGRSGGEIAGVDLVHGGEIVHVLEIDGGLDDAVERRAGSFEDSFEIFEDAGGLRGDVAGNELLGGGVERNLAGKKKKAVGANGLRIRADGARAAVGGDDVAHDGHLSA